MHNRFITKIFQLERNYSWSSKTTIARLRVSRPSLRQAAIIASSKENNLIKLCNYIIAAHSLGAFGGKPALWDFMRDVTTRKQQLR